MLQATIIDRPEGGVRQSLQDTKGPPV